MSTPPMEYRYVIVFFNPFAPGRHDVFGAVEDALAEGWVPVRETPMGACGAGAGPSNQTTFASLLLLERPVPSDG